MEIAEHKKMIDDFESHYKYDSNYMRDLLAFSPAGFEKFANFLPLARHRQKLVPEDYWIAKLAAMQVEDCGDCLQLNVRMALEDQIDRQMIKHVLYDYKKLSPELQDVYSYAKAVAAHEVIDESLMQRMQARYDQGSLLEFGLAIASAKVFPTIKRAAANINSCSIIQIEV